MVMAAAGVGCIQLSPDTREYKLKTFWISAVLALAADLLSKHFIFAWLMPTPSQACPVVPGWLRISLHINEGAVWGMGGEHPTLLLLVTALIIPAVGVMAWSCRHEKAPLWALGVLLGGAAGNLYDRIFTTVQLNRYAEPVAGVRDFIDMGIPGVYNWPVFNVADIAIVVGVIIFAWWNIFLSEKKAKQAAGDGTSGDASDQPPSA